MARTTTTYTASCSGCPPRRSRRSPKRASSERVLRQKLFDTELRCRQRLAGLPLPDELAVGEQLRRLLGDRERMRLIVARQHQARRPAARHERAVHAVEEAGTVQVLVERIQHLLGGLGVVLEGPGPRVESRGAARGYRSDPPDGLGE